jgi:hypothetical protein
MSTSTVETPVFPDPKTPRLPGLQAEPPTLLSGGFPSAPRLEPENPPLELVPNQRAFLPIEPVTGPKLTKKVRRGLALMRSVVFSALDPTQPAPDKLVATWPKYLQDDFNTAMAWIEFNEQAPQPKKAVKP